MDDNIYTKNYGRTTPETRRTSKLPKNVVKDGTKWLMVPSKIIMESLCVWPHRQNNFTRAVHVILVTSFLLGILGQYFYITDENADLGNIAFAISFMIVSIETLTRRLLCYFYRDNLSKILLKVYFEFWPSDIAGKELHEQLSKESWNLYLYCAAYMFSAFLCAVQYIVLPIFSGDLPQRTKYPFPWWQSPYYEILYVWESFMSMELAFNVCGLDMFFVSLLSNCVAQFKLLRSFLQQNFELAFRQKLLLTSDNKHEGPRLATPMEVLLLCIERHKSLIRACKDIEKIFTYFILIQYLTSMTTVCLSSFVATVISQQVGTSVTYLMGHVCEIFIYCYMGESLIIESTELSNAVSECGWHLANYDKDLQRTLIMIMVRSQKPIRISAGGFGYLSLTSFMKLAQFSFSVYTLLNSLMKKQIDIN